MNKLLMVDDDVMILDSNRQYFTAKGYDVICVKKAGDAWKLISSAALDCIILDIDLPDESGFDLCIRIRQNTNIPIVFLSGYTEEESRIRGLLIGGDDYVCKPYSLEELELRVRARIKAGRTAYPPRNLQYGDLVINPGNRTVTYKNVSADLSTYEFDVLYFLAQNPEQVFSYEQIYDHIWHAPVNRGVKSLQMIIVRIRQKLLNLSPAHDYIQTVRRKGYLFVP